MEIIVFLIISSIGLITTRTLLKAISLSENFTQNKYAITIASGLGLTWFFSFLTPIAVAHNWKIDIHLFLFIATTSFFVWIISFLVSRFLIRVDVNNQNLKDEES